MRRESLVFGIAGTFFGLLMGWILGSQRETLMPAPATTTSQAAQQPAGPPPPPPLDTQRVSQLEAKAKGEPANASIRVELGDTYMDAQQFDRAIPWYEKALTIDPKNIDASTDLAVCYYYANDPDRALAQLDKSLSLNPKHAKTLLNQGIIRAFGKSDLKGAEESWTKVVAVAPDSAEAKRAKQGLEGLKSGHDGAAGTSGSGRGGDE